MNLKRILILLVVAGVLAGLIYWQYNSWKQFDWATFARETGGVRSTWYFVALAVACIYAADVLRAVRWKVFLKPVRNARISDLVAPQFIGFTGLALLGRPGELVRPYIIAKKENLSLSSQMAVWTVERIFDIGGFTTLMVLDIFIFGERLPFSGKLRDAGYVLVGIVLAMAAGAWLIRRFGPPIADAVEQTLRSRSPRLAAAICSKIRAFGQGLNTIHDVPSFAQLAGISVLIWLLVALSYRCVMLAYRGTVLESMMLPEVMLIMGSSMVGSMLQLPAVGGGSQLATITMMHSGYNVPIELATSAGILLWLVTFVSVVPAGLLVAHHEHVSLRTLSKEATAEEPATEPVSD